jgi:plasmid stabilization system protein ParE
MAFRVDVTPEAAADIAIAAEYIARESPARAARWLGELQRKLQTLEHNPERCPLVSESDAFSLPIRELLHGGRRGTYRILFIVSRDRVEVIRVMHGARHFPK